MIKLKFSIKFVVKRIILHRNGGIDMIFLTEEEIP